MKGNFILVGNDNIILTTNTEDNRKPIYCLVNGIEFYGHDFGSLSFKPTEQDRKGLVQTYRDNYFSLLPTATQKIEQMVVTEMVEQKKRDKELENAKQTGSESIDLSLEWQKVLSSTFVEIAGQKVVENIIPEIMARMEKEVGLKPYKTIEIVTDITKKEVNGIFHEKFETVLKLVANRIPVYLVGDAGTGKNVIAEQVATALDLEFYFTNAVTQEYKLTGFIDANGRYQETAFYKAFKNGGLFFLDEMDASIPEALIIINGAIANGYFDFPNGKIVAHTDFRVISAGNTFGTGADSMYNGRYQLDGATLNRFVPLEIDYSETIENSFSHNKEMLEFVRTFRKACKEVGVNCVVSYRNIIQFDTMLQIQIDPKDIIKMALTKELGKDDISIIHRFMANKIPHNLFVSTLSCLL